MFALVVANTRVTDVRGISAAGSDPEMVRFTAVLDAEFLLWGRPLTLNAIPVDPQGHPSPVVISRACLERVGFPVLVLDAGCFVRPMVPLVDLRSEPGGRIDLEDGAPQARRLLEWGLRLGEELSKVSRELWIGESVPGGTTTAMAVLRALGYRATTSSSGPHNPVGLKEEVVGRAFERAFRGVERHREDPLSAVESFGDPMMPVAMGLSLGFRGRRVLCGGTQMLAVAAALRWMGGLDGDLQVATTKYVAQDPNANFREVADEIGVETLVAPLDFSGSKHRGLRDYELGFIKEGVGAGGCAVMALESGLSPEEIAKATEEVYEGLLRGGHAP